MKTLFITPIALLFFSFSLLAQHRARVTATDADISENLDLRAVASVFGDSRNLEDFEQRLNDPRNQISNLDLNGDNRVDYLRVIETVDNYLHLVVIQAVIGHDIFQDVATIEVDRNSSRNVNVQVVGNPYFYGNNYIYEPVYANYPVIYNYFYVSNYSPYHSIYYYNYYPQYFTYWQPYPVYRYRRNIYRSIHTYNTYSYVNYRRNDRAVALYNNRNSNGYASAHPERSFQRRHTTLTNAYDIKPVRNNYATGGIRVNSLPATASVTNAQPLSNNLSANQNTGGIRSNGNLSTQVPVENNANVTTGGIRTNTYVDQTPRNPVRASITNNQNTPRKASPSHVDATPRPSVPNSTRQNSSSLRSAPISRANTNRIYNQPSQSRSSLSRQ